jgi:hypothetical protein
MTVFTVPYLLVGIAILVEVLRRLGVSFIAVRRPRSCGARTAT